MAAPERFAEKSDSPCTAGTVHTWPICMGALQVESDDLEKLVLRFCIRPIDGAVELLAIMDIRARSISFTTRPRRPYGPPDHERAGETFFSISSF
jgi:hypothetical protein